MAQSLLSRDRRSARPARSRLPVARGAGAVVRRPPERHGLEGAVGAVEGEVRHLLEIEEKGETAATPVLVMAHVLIAVSIIVAVELVVAFAFYFGWL